MVCRSALALPLGEARVRAAQRICESPRLPLGGVDSPYQGEMPRRGKGGRDSCRRRRLMRGRVLIFELLRVFEPNVAAAQNVQLFSSSGAPRHLPLKGKASDGAVQTKKTSRSGRLFCSDLYSLLYATAILLAAWALLYASSRLEAKDLPPVISLICASRYGVMFLPWMCSAFACATACSMMPFM